MYHYFTICEIPPNLQDEALRGLLILNPEDFYNVFQGRIIDMGLLKIKNQIFTVTHHESMKKESIGLNKIQRDSLSFNIQDQTYVEPLFEDPFVGPPLLRAIMEVDFLNEQNSVPGGVERSNVQKGLQKYFNERYLTQNQCFLVELEMDKKVRFIVRFLFGQSTVGKPIGKFSATTDIELVSNNYNFFKG